jgi:hypothetical protein
MDLNNYLELLAEKYVCESIYNIINKIIIKSMNYYFLRRI